MIKKIGGQATLINDPQELKSANKIILPGVGAFDTAMNEFRKKGWEEPAKEFMKSGKPILGICLGMQMLTHSSEEGTAKGLGWVNAKTVRFPASVGRIPHMGWNIGYPSKPSKLLVDDGSEQRFYFVHSYYVELQDQKDELLQTHYGIQFTSGFEHNNILGVQFHPEKSHKFGMALLKNFAEKY
jgi:glutamine amidotransferase